MARSCHSAPRSAYLHDTGQLLLHCPQRITETQLPELRPAASCGRKNQCRLHSFSGQNDTSKRCPSQQLYLISMLARLHSCLINIFTEDDKGYPDFPLACLWPCLLVLPIINRCCLARSHPRGSQGSRNILDFPPWCWWRSAQPTKQRRHTNIEAHKRLTQSWRGLGTLASQGHIWAEEP